MMKQMLAAVLTEPGAPLDLREVPVPVPGPGELLIKLEACGVCHTDLHVRDGSASAAGHPHPLILGHEGIGRVVAQGPGAKRYELGERLALPWLHDTCGSCPECLGGSESFCADQRAHGFSVHGGFAEYAIVRESFTTRIPDGLDPVTAAPLLCAGVTAYGAIRKAELAPGKTCMVVGCGGLGLYAVQLAKQSGAQVVAVDTSQRKLDIAREAGADHTFLAGEDPGGRTRDLGGADACINFAPSAAPWKAMVDGIRPRGWIIGVAMVPDPVPLSMEWLTYTGARITGTSVGTRQELNELLQIGARTNLKIPTERVDLRNVNDALDRLAQSTVDGRMVIEFDSFAGR
ncbi:MAG: zinc-dependent alcohol dehydrogenase [Rhodospirillaceae bacterium]|nr:MAG: zinc-dependent alcohol dehydrogenase [Rhodospirillaceae bacterium]